MAGNHAHARESILEAILSVSNRFDASSPSARFDELGVDSFDLVTIRCALEQKLGRGIPDQTWLRFRGVDDIVAFYLEETSPEGHAPVLHQIEGLRQLKINMPQMAIGGLSESWMIKELGDVHWQGICSGLHTESDRISDAAGNRLYATFVRFRWEGSRGLKSFRENELIRIDNQQRRFGKGMFFSDASIEGFEKTIRASLMSAFTSRQGDNKSLLKGDPIVPEDCPIEALGVMPQFCEEYRQMRKSLSSGVPLCGESVPWTSEVISEIEYSINPYQDINGVNLLYFAAYPLISDICEREFVHRNRERFALGSDWALETSTVARDIFYFGNCEIDEKLLFRLHSFTVNSGGKVMASASLSRKSDRQLLCRIFTVKERTV